MLNEPRIIIDTASEVYNILRPYCHGEFWDFADHTPESGSIYVVGRKQLVENLDKVRCMAEQPDYVMVFCNAAEGSSTLREQCSRVLKIDDLIHDHRLLLITGGDLPQEYPSVMYEHLLCCIIDYQSNMQQMARSAEIYEKIHKPYKFLFLNGRGRPHRKYLLERFRMLGMLEHALWTYLDGRASSSRLLSLKIQDREMMSTVNPVRSLPEQYEVERYRCNRPSTAHLHHFAKGDIFNNEWGEIYLQAEPYIDTYFSVVTETVFEYPYSFRTEKIAKVLAQGHPWICAASRGWYRDLRNLGFRTFEHVIDESFDLIDDHQSRMERLIEVVQDLCEQDLEAFLDECESACKYNQQHLLEFAQQHRRNFTDRFFQFIERHARS